MCYGPLDQSSRLPSDLTWHLDEDGGSWRLTVQTGISQKPLVDLRPEAVRLAQDADAVVLPVPMRAQPVNVDSARCSFSGRRRELVVKWPRIGSEEIAAEADEEARAGCQCHDSEKHLGDDGDFETKAHCEDATDEAVESRSASSSEEEWVRVSRAPSLTGSDIFAPGSDSASSEAVPREPESSTGAQGAEEATSCTDDARPASPARSAEEWKVLGNEAVKAGDHAAALDCYSAGLAVEPDHAILLSNRAHALYMLGRLEEGLADARRCVSLRPDFVKGFLRSAKILRELGRSQEALEMLRRAPLDVEVEKMSAEVKPEAEAAEERRIAALGGAERKKEEGNVLFKKGLFEQALPVYNEALACCSDPVGELALAIRNNRAGCYHQLSNFEGVVEDTNFVLEQQPDNLKALMRRMLALEPLEKYEAALRDARAVLRQLPGHEAANRLQHRLGRLVREQDREKSRA